MQLLVSELTVVLLKFNIICTYNTIVSSNPTHREVYSIQHYVIKFVSDFWQVGGFLQGLRFPPPIKLSALCDILKIKERLFNRGI